MIRTRLSEYAIPASVIIGAIVLTLFGHWEPTHESFGLWTFARVLSEGGGFIIPDRSPLYTLYLNGFRWLGYPTSVTVEYVVTSFIVITALVALFRPYIGLGLAVFAAILWLPILQTYSEPPVQKLALACSCWAIIARQEKNTRLQWALSYALMGLASMFRNSYIIFIPVFAIGDIWRIHRQRGKKALFRAVRPQLSDWPIALVVILLICFHAIQSPHRWNNTWYTSTTWFPNDGKKMIDANLQNYNWKYIENKYGTFEGKDFYFTNQELFGGASTFKEAVRANPQFIIEQTGRNLKDVLWLSATYPLFAKVFTFLPYLVIVPTVLFGICYGAFRAARDESMILFVIANVLLIGVMVLAIPKQRYMLPFIPVLILSASWYGTKIREVIMPAILRSPKTLFWGGLVGAGLILLKIASSPKEIPLVKLYTAVTVAAMLIIFASSGYLARGKSQQWLSSLRRLTQSLAIPLTFMLFSNILWLSLIKDTVKDSFRGELRVLEGRPYSLKTSFAELEPLIKKSKGILSLESTFVAAFMDVPLGKVYDIWEIPPFGHLGNSVYNGLQPNRIDCVLVSHDLENAVGCATNVQIRYQNYIKPYIKQLQQLGAKTYEIQGFGKAIVMPKS